MLLLPDLVLMDKIESRFSFSKHHEEIVSLLMLQALKKFTEGVSNLEFAALCAPWQPSSTWSEMIY